MIAVNTHRIACRVLVACCLALAFAATGVGGVVGADYGTIELVSRPTGVADPDTADVFFGGVSVDGGRVFSRRVRS
jgi:hypothetical protein